MSARLMMAALVCAGAGAAMSGCAWIGAASGAAAGVATGTFTANPAIGIGVGIAVQSATDAAVKRYFKAIHRDEQDAIATLVGDMSVGESKPWRIEHTLPIDNGHGEVRVTRAFDTALATCKEFAFSLVDGDKPDAKVDWFTASACRQGTVWKWASAEPAVERWGTLQ
ncbi:MAG: hypothetical protein ACTHKH_08435 [Trinickia sp.]|jgi:hypothetical protein